MREPARVKQVPARMPEPGQASSLSRQAAPPSPAKRSPPGSPRCPAGRQPPQRRADGKLRPLRRQDGFQGAVRRRLDLDRRLVGLELDQRLAHAHALAGLFQPAQHRGRFHRRAELGNQKVHRGASLKHDPVKQSSSLPSFPRKRESRATSASTVALDSRFRGNDEKRRGRCPSDRMPFYSSDLTAAAMESGEGSTLSSSGGL